MTAGPIYRFAGFSLDTGACLLRNGSGEIALRPKSFDLLSYLIRNAGRVVPKAELMDAVWPNVTVTDDSLTQCISDIRRALEDANHVLLRTVSRRGYLLSGEAIEGNDLASTLASKSGSAQGGGDVAGWGLGIAAWPVDDAMPNETADGRRLLHALVTESLSADPLDDLYADPLTGMERTANPPPQPSPTRSSGRTRAAIAILPFSADVELSLTADGVTRDVVRALSRSRGLFVIAANSTSVLRSQGVEARDSGRLLKVDYVCSGSISATASDLRLDVELITAAEGRVLWSEGWRFPATDAVSAGEAIAAECTQAIAAHVDLNERHLAIRKHAGELDAWEAYHRGLWHMYRFTRADNIAAQRLFDLSIRLDPSFSQPYASLSFTHWMSAFMLAPGSEDEEAGLAFDAAARGVATDAFDPAAQAALGRALWIKGAPDEAVAALDTSVRLSPNFAFGHYSMGFIQSFSGDPQNGIDAIDRARELSPFDPFLCAMHVARAAALLRLGRTKEAAAWGVRAARQPNAHAHIQRLGAICLASAGKSDEANSLARYVSARSPGNGGEHFFRSLRLGRSDEALIRRLARQCNLD